jgi:signal transduction histidine kinase/DNA-binding response OmpR family regulator/ligand-binding sensor domain-containing protein
MKSSFTIAILFLFVQLCFSQPQHRFRHYSKKDGLANDFAWTLVQDSLGYIWVQYYGGLSRFDGYNFKVYKYDPEDTLRSALNFVLGALLIDPSGNLWITEHRPGNVAKTGPYTLVRYDRKSDGFVKYEIDIQGAMPGFVSFDKDSSQVWIGTTNNGLFNFDFQSGKTTNYAHRRSDGKSPYQLWGGRDLSHSLLLATDVGLWEFDKTLKTFHRPKCDPKDSSSLFHSEIFRFVGVGNNWIQKRDTLIRINSDLSVVQKIHFPYGVGSWGSDDDGVLWFYQYGRGLLRFDSNDSSLVSIEHDPDNPSSPLSNELNDVNVDADQNVWLNSMFGLSVMRKREVDFHNIKIGGRVWGNIVFNGAGKDHVLISEGFGGDPPDRLLSGTVTPGKLDETQLKPVGLPISAGAMSIHRGKHRLWLATANAGVIGIPIDSQTGIIMPGPLESFRHDPDNENSIRSDFTLSTWEDPNNSLWVGRMRGLDRIDLNSRYGTPGSVERFKELNGYTFIPENDKSFWSTSTSGGLSLVNLPSSPNGSYQIETIFTPGEAGPYSFRKLSDGTLLFGTSRGLYEIIKVGDRYSGKLIPIFRNIEINSIQEDRLGRLWFYNDGRISCFDRKDSIMASFDERDGIDHVHAVEPHWMHQTSSGIFVVVSQEGVSLFDPISFKFSNKKTYPVLTKMDVNNVTLNGRSIPGDVNFKIPTDIGMLRELILDYQHNNFSIEFSAMQMAAPEKNLYRHKLEGYDQDWIKTDYKNRTATYTNLDPGTYTFRVKASNHHGVWSDQERTLLVKILPPPWKSWWAYTGYFLIVAGLLFGARRMIVQRERLKAHLNLAKVEQEKEHFELEKAKEVDQLKTRFFANISHEFRTPITLVLGPLRDHYKQLTNPDQKNIIGSVIRNGQRLQRLINQLLDLSKVEAGKMKLHSSQGDIVELLRQIVSSYESLAKEKNIRYFFYPEVKELMMYVDEEKIEKIIHNLLSNAFKFTQAGGEIIVNLRVAEKSALISVADSGIGIAVNQLDKIFDRFYQVDSSQTRDYEGSGLGLALVKDLVELHHGGISVDSKEGKGTTFTVSLPMGKEHLQKEEIVESGVSERTEALSQDLVSTNGVGVEKEATKEKETALEHPVILIVEDNVDMRQYIRKTLSSHYQIIEAENGREGVSKAEEAMPDLIISDIMMAEMDGYKLCSMIKSKELTSHIPVILLTAKADRESKLSGLEIGADDYLSKPFDADELKLLIRNRIEERRKMRERFSREITLEPKQISVTSLDEKFITKVLTMIENHMDDEEFSIEDFSEAAGCSRMQFYRKIKGLTDQTPSQFVRSIRLKRAAQLLLAKSDNVSQIAYSVGFSSLAYFNKCFKEQFGVTPGQYAETSLRARI